MAKFILSVGDGTFEILASEAKRRDVTVQQLLRAVIVPEWVRENVEDTGLRGKEKRCHSAATPQSGNRPRMGERKC